MNESHQSFNCGACNESIFAPSDLPATTAPCPHCGEPVTSPGPQPEGSGAFSAVPKDVPIPSEVPEPVKPESSKQRRRRKKKASKQSNIMRATPAPAEYVDPDVLQSKEVVPKFVEKNRKKEPKLEAFPLPKEKKKTVPAAVPLVTSPTGKSSVKEPEPELDLGPLDDVKSEPKVLPMPSSGVEKKSSLSPFVLGVIGVIVLLVVAFGIMKMAASKGSDEPFVPKAQESVKQKIKELEERDFQP